MIKLLKIHVIRCPSDGAIRVTSSKVGRCFKCGHTWNLIDKQQGGTRGVIDSFYCPKQATERAMKEKEMDGRRKT